MGTTLLTEKPVTLAIVIVMIIVLMVVGIRPIYTGVKAFLSIDQQESADLTQLKEKCNDAYDKIDDSTERLRENCALEVADRLLKEEGDYFQAHTFLMRQLEKGINDKDTYEIAFDIAKELYSKSGDWKAASQLYTLLYPALLKSSSKYAEEARLAWGKASTTYNIDVIKKYNQDVLSRLREAQAIYLINTAQQLKPFYQAVVESYKNKAIGDEAILGHSPTGKESCNFVFEIGNQPIPVAIIKDLANVCNSAVRASAKYGCYFVPRTEAKEVDGIEVQCASCNGYQPADSCTGYLHQWTCEANPCEVPLNCVWSGSSCSSPATPSSQISPSAQTAPTQTQTSTPTTTATPTPSQPQQEAAPSTVPTTTPTPSETVTPTPATSPPPSQ